MTAPPPRWPLSQLALGVGSTSSSRRRSPQKYADALGLRAGGPPEEPAPTRRVPAEAHARAARRGTGASRCAWRTTRRSRPASRQRDRRDDSRAVRGARRRGRRHAPRRWCATRTRHGGDASGERPATAGRRAPGGARFALAPRIGGRRHDRHRPGPALASGAMAWWRAAGLEAAERDCTEGRARADADALAALLGWIEGDGFGADRVAGLAVGRGAAGRGARDAWTGVLRAARADLVASREVALTRQGAEARRARVRPDDLARLQGRNVFSGVLRGEETFAVKVDVARVPSRAWARRAKAAFRGWWSDRNPSGRRQGRGPRDGRPGGRARSAACCCRRTRSRS